MTQILSPLTTTATRACEERQALSLLTDDQAMASFVRFRTKRDCVTAESLRTAKDYVDAIYAKVSE